MRGSRVLRPWGRALAAVAIAGVTTLVGLVTLKTEALAGLRERAADAVTFPRGAADPSVAVVAIDARSVRELGQAWPWPRERQAELVDAIARAGAKVVVLDVVLAPASTSDAMLSAALATIPSVISAGLESSTDRDRQWSRAGVLLASDYTEPAPTFSDAAVAVGHSGVTPSASDGVTRTLPLIVDWNRTIRPSLALAAIQAVEGSLGPVIVRPRAIQVGSRSIPTDARHQLRISYSDDLAGSRSTTVSALDVLHGVAPERLGGKVVFVGVVDPIAGDRLLTPLAKRSGMPGVYIHANAFNTMVTRTYLEQADDGTVAVWLFALALTVAMATLLGRLWFGVLMAGTALAGFMLMAVASANRGTVVDVVHPVVGIAVALLASAGIRELLVDRHRRRIASMFAQYVPPRVAQELVGEHRTSGLLDGKRLNATVIFCDIRGFTPLTATLSPPQIRQLLDSYYTLLSEVVLTHGGSVLRYTGDEILAAFGAPAETADHPRRAIECAIDMQAARPELTRRLDAEGLPGFGYGIGIQTGDVVSAVMGSSIRRQYAVIGTPLTLGSRLCAQAGIDEIVISIETWQRRDGAAHDHGAERFSTSLKGRQEGAELIRLFAGPVVPSAGS